MLISSHNHNSILSLKDTNILKGIALLFLLWHHLFYTGKMPVDDIMIGHYPLVQTLGIWCKVCVAIFVFLSGYGLTVSAEKNGGIGKLWQFYKKRYLKLMINYWFIYLIFVSFGVFVMGRTFEAVYHGSIVRAILDFLGLHFAVTRDYFGYNATWWFYGCIIMLYAIFPLLYRFKRFWWIIVPLAFISYRWGGRIPLFHACAIYVPSFVAGMYFALTKYLSINIKIYFKVIVFLFMPIICLLRLYTHHFILWDAVISLYITATYLILDLPRNMLSPLAFIGKHSFNIFLFHTFFFSLYFREYIYWTQNPILIFSTLFIVCIVTSIILERIKEHIGINKLQKYLTK